MRDGPSRKRFLQVNPHAQVPTYDHLRILHTEPSRRPATLRACNGTPLDHENGLETVTLRGTVTAIQTFAARLIALRGVRNGHVHFVPLHKGSAHRHDGPPSALHNHFEPSV